VRRLPELAPIAVAVVLPLPDGVSVYFDAGLSSDPDGDGIARVRWRFGDGATSSRRAGVHTYDAPGAYRIALRVVDDDGLDDTAATRVAVGGRLLPRLLEVALPARVLFDAGAAQVRGDGRALLARVARAVRRARTVRVEAHTDDLGPAAYNLALSRRRAAAVRRALIARGVDRGRIAAAGVGEATRSSRTPARRPASATGGS
jgi:outer membrane protein OmpA-like peptidoglycan-associated protein